MTRLKTLVARRAPWQDDLSCIRRMHGWVLQAEAILGGTWAAAEEVVSNAEVATRFDGWVATLRANAREQLTATEQRCLAHFLHVTDSLRPQLLQCYDVTGMPRTNNDMEGFIRAIKTRYRRMSGRKNWNRYLLRYGRRVAYYEARARMETGTVGNELGMRQVTPTRWRAAQAEQRQCQAEQLKQYRFRHKRTAFLAGLEARWMAALLRTVVLPERTLPLP